jgi:hypothetical protein
MSKIPQVMEYHDGGNQRRLSIMAVWSLLLSVVSMPLVFARCFTPIQDFMIRAGVPVGHRADHMAVACISIPTFLSMTVCSLAYQRIKRKPRELCGAGLAIAGIILCLIWFCVTAFLWYLVTALDGFNH